MLMIGKQLTVEQRLQKATIAILAHPSKKYAGISGVLIYGDITVDDVTPTACTDGRNERYGRAYVEGLTDAELRFLRLHETYHKMYRHLTTWQHLWKDDAQLANRACDYVINLKLMDADAGEKFIAMPEGGMLDQQYCDMDAGQVYNLLKKEKEKEKEKKDGKPGEGKPGEGKKEGGKPGDGGDGKPGEGEPSGAGMDEHDWEGAGKLTHEEQSEIARDIDDALRQGAILAGKTGSGGLRGIGELLQCKVRWEDAVREWLNQQVAGDDYSSWNRLHRRGIAEGEYLPGGESEVIEEVVFAIDTSGSIGGKEISQFLGEVVGFLGALHPEKVRILYWDTQVCREEIYFADQLDDLIRTTKPSGGGGTDPRCVVDYLNKNGIKPQCVVMLTDGYVGTWGTWSVPVLWCIVGNKSANPAVGQTVHVEF